MVMLKVKNEETYFPIAIVGVGLRMPGCSSTKEFEQRLINEKTMIKKVPDHRWNVENYYHKDNSRRARYCITKLATCENYYDFDAEYFDMKEEEAAVLDPQQKQVLEVTEMALEDAGILPENLPKNTGVYMGMGLLDFIGIVMLDNERFFSDKMLYGASHSTVANRVSSRYGLTGPSVATDTACAASLTAVHVAAMSLWNREVECAIAGATSYLLSPEITVAFSKLGVLSSTGNSAPFDISNNGYVRGEGTSMIIMKPLDQALRDNDNIYCCLRSTASAHNGYSNSLTLPSMSAQSHLIEKCYSQSEIPFDKLTFVEAHGTGTPVGDPIETEALGNAIGSKRKEVLPISSSKSTFGHLEVCAGMVQVVKATVMIKNRMFYRHINWTAPIPKVNLNELNLKIQTKREPYTKEDSMVVAINSFGFGGSLVHMVFEEFQEGHGRSRELSRVELANWSLADKRHGETVLMPISGKSKNAMIRNAELFLEWMTQSGEIKCNPLPDTDARYVSSWLMGRRQHHAHSALLQVKSSQDYVSKLTHLIEVLKTDKPTAIEGVFMRNGTVRPLVLVFGGKGQEFTQMGVNLYSKVDSFRTAVDQCDEMFKTISGYSALKKFKLFTSEATKQNKFDTAACKPGIVFYQIAFTDMLTKLGVKATSVIGKGMGEVGALYASGLFTLKQVIHLLALRMESPPKEDFLFRFNEIINMKTKPIDRETCQLYLVDGTEVNKKNISSDLFLATIVKEYNMADCLNKINLAHSNATFMEVSAQKTLEKEMKDLHIVNHHFVSGEAAGSEQLLMALVMLHSKGQRVAWQHVYKRCAGIHVNAPLYGWQHKRYVLESLEYNEKIMGTDQRTLEGRKGEIDMMLFEYLNFYKLFDKYVYPAAALVEFLSQNDQRRFCCLKDIEMVNGVQFIPCDSEGFTKTIIIQCDIAHNKIELCTRENKMKIANATFDQSMKYLKQRQICLNDLFNTCTYDKPISEVYQQFENAGLTLGEMFMFMSELRVDKKNSLAIGKLVQSVNLTERIQSQLLEGAFQVGLASFVDSYHLYIPVYVASLQMFVGRLPDHADLYAVSRLRSVDVLNLIFDVDVVDEKGFVLISLKGIVAQKHENNPDDEGLAVLKSNYRTIDELRSHVYKTNWQTNDAVSLKDLPAKKCINKRDQLILADYVNLTILDLLKRTDLDVDTVTMLKHLKKNNTPPTATPFEVKKRLQPELALLDALNFNPHKFRQSISAYEDKFRSLTCIFNHFGYLLRECNAIKNSIKVAIFANENVELILEILGKQLYEEIMNLTLELVIISEDTNLNILYNNVKFLNKLEGRFDIIFTRNLSDSLKENVLPCGSIITANEAQNNSFTLLKSAFTKQHIDDTLSIEFDESAFKLKSQEIINSPITIYLDIYELLEDPNNKKLKTNYKVVADDDNDSKTTAKNLCSELKLNKIYNLNEFLKSFNPNDSDDVILLLNTCDSTIPTQKRIKEVYNSMMKGNNSLNLFVIMKLAMGNTCSTQGKIAEITDKSLADQSEFAAINSLCRKLSNEITTGDSSVAVHSFKLSPACKNMAEDILSMLRQTESGNLKEREISSRGNSLLVPKIAKLNPNKTSTTNEFKINISNDKLHFVNSSRKSLSKEIPNIRINSFVKLEDNYLFSGEMQRDDGNLMKGDIVLGFNKCLHSAKSEKVDKLVRCSTSRLNEHEIVRAVQRLHMHAEILSEFHGADVLLIVESSEFNSQADDIVRLAGIGANRVMSCCYDPLRFGTSGVSVTSIDPYDIQASVKAVTDGRGVDIVIVLGDSAEYYVTEQSLAYSACVYGHLSNLISGNFSQLFHDSITMNQLKTVVDIVAHNGPIKVLGSEVVRTVPMKEYNNTVDKQGVVFVNRTEGSSPVAKITLDPESSILITGLRTSPTLSSELLRWLLDNGARHVVSVECKSDDPNVPVNDSLVNTALRYVRDQGMQVDRITSGYGNNFNDSLLKKTLTRNVDGVFNLGFYEGMMGGNNKACEEAVVLARNMHSFLQKNNIKSPNFVTFTSSKISYGDRNITDEMTEAFSRLDNLSMCRRGAGLSGLSLQMSDIEDLSTISNNGLLIMDQLDILAELLVMDKCPPVVTIQNKNWTEIKSLCYEENNRFSQFCSANDGDGAGNSDDLVTRFKRYLCSMTGSTEEQIDEARPMMAFGMDSLMSTDMISWANENFSVVLTQAEIFAGLSINDIINRI